MSPFTDPPPSCRPPRLGPGGLRPLVLLVLLVLGLPGIGRTAPAGQPTRLHISGFVLDTHQDPVKDARVTLTIAGVEQALRGHGDTAGPVRTRGDGSFVASLPLPEPLPTSARIELLIRKSGFRDLHLDLTPADFALHGGSLFLERDLVMSRSTGPGFWVAAAVLLMVYVLITLELIHRTVVAMLGAALLLAISALGGKFFPELRIISFETAVAKIDQNVVFLLLGMMVIVGVLKESGVFQWAAARCYSIARGRILVLSLLLMGLTALASAFLDNVTTMLLIAPVTIEIAAALHIAPVALLIPEVLAANVGGAATLIGDPPNIMIGSYAGLTFLAFLQNLGLVCLLALVPLALLGRHFYGDAYRQAAVDDPAEFARTLRREYRITDPVLLKVGLAILTLVIALFVSHGYWQMEVSVAALTGAALLFTFALVTGKVRLQDFIEREIDWGTLLFFIFLFMVIGAVEEAGLLSAIADGILALSRGNLTAAICLILWGSALMSAFVDNIPFTATMLPVTAYLSQVIPGTEGHVLWWALALGACLGGNGTLIGASANVVTVGLAEARGHHISFRQFFRIGFLYMVLSVAICNLWLLLFY